MKLNEKIVHESSDKMFTGRKNGFKVVIYFCDKQYGKTAYWYYLLDKDDFSYSSLWSGLKYEDMESCVAACEDKIEDLSNTKAIYGIAYLHEDEKGFSKTEPWISGPFTLFEAYIETNSYVTNRLKSVTIFKYDNKEQIDENCEYNWDWVLERKVEM